MGRKKQARLSKWCEVHDMGSAFSPDKPTFNKINVPPEWIQGALDQTTIALLFLNLKGEIAYANPAFFCISEANCQAVEGVHLCSLSTNPTQEARLSLAWAEAQKGVTWTGHYLDQNKDGSRKIFELTLQPVFNEKDVIISYLALFTDITEIIQKEEEALHSQKMETIGTLAGGIAHDFNNMLGLIIGHSDLILNRMDPEEEHYHSLAEIQSAASRSARLTRQLLLFSSKRHFHADYLNLNLAVGNIRAMLGRIIGENIELAWEPSLVDMCVHVDHGHLDQTLLNLVINARDAISGSGKIELKTKLVPAKSLKLPAGLEEAFENYALISVKDTGSGMTQGIKDRMFDPFFTTKNPNKSTGLGLSTVFGIVRASHGFIEVDSSTNGVGTTIRLYLPSFPMSKVRSEVALPEVDLGGRETILLVEDELALGELIATVLRQAGYTVIGATSAEMALQLTETTSKSIHLLLTDVLMQDMHGVQLATILKAQKPDLKCIYMSGYSSDILLDYESAPDLEHFLEKPFTASELTSAVRKRFDCRE